MRTTYAQFARKRKMLDMSKLKCSFFRNMFVNRLRLADILVRPMQRLTKYTLLLTAIRKHITDENDAEIMDAMVSDRNNE